MSEDSKSPYLNRRQVSHTSHGDAAALALLIDRMELMSLERVQKIKDKLVAMRRSEHGGLSPSELMILQACGASIMQRQIGAVPVERRPKRFKYKKH